ncbi:uncharacterized protein LOC113782077 [Coffea eugenioides]|uniref:uncharacterized protein LOC113782077 n=1 Tax=Coffea eugenioides TaxID=49369 RepID=UPI000F615525|nr:uncharacterized protein LOC113782077 [Coffea eugenioides]
MAPSKKGPRKVVGPMSGAHIESTNSLNPALQSSSQSYQTCPSHYSKPPAHKFIGAMPGIRIDPTSSSNSVSRPNCQAKSHDSNSNSNSASSFIAASQFNSKANSHQLNSKADSQLNSHPNSHIGQGFHSQPLVDHREQPDSFDNNDSEAGSGSSYDSEDIEDVFDGTFDDDDSSEEGDNSGRGLARRSAGWGGGKKLELVWNARGQVIGPNATQYISQVGILVKDGNKLPLTYTDWRAMPEGSKERFWEDIKRNTNIDDTCKKVQMIRVSKLWRNWKSKVKSMYFTPYRRHRSWLLAHCPARVEEDQWPILVDYWSLEDVKATMNEEIQKLPETSRDDNFVKDILYENILGPEKPGRLRTYGGGATPKDVYRMSDNMNDGQKKAFEDAVNEKVEIIRGELREEMNSKLANFKEELIAQFEARMRASTCDLASLQRREMNAAKQSQISDSLEVGDRMNREVGTNDAEMYKEIGTNDAEINKCEMNKKVSSIADILENHHTKKKRSRTTCKRLA